MMDIDTKLYDYIRWSITFDGATPHVSDMAKVFRITETEVRASIEILVHAGLLRHREQRETLELVVDPHCCPRCGYINTGGNRADGASLGNVSPPYSVSKGRVFQGGDA